MKNIFFILLLIAFNPADAQVPVFGNDIPVAINGYTLDAMEPFISPDGNAMFFNSLNDGNATSLYYAARVNDSTYNLVGLVPIVNQSVTPRLDGVASVDTSNNFYWVSTRNYPASMDNLFRIRFLQSSYTNFGRVHGDIYVYSPGWLIMDAAINYPGDKLLYCNAQFNGCQFNLPCRSALGFAQKTNDSTFTKLSNSGTILANVNDTVNYLIYAPQLSKNELELYFTRAIKNVAQTEICVSVRTNTNSQFGFPSVLIPMSASASEAPTISSDQLKLYYHKNSGGKYKLFLRYRTGTTSLNESQDDIQLNVYPNPTTGLVRIYTKDLESVAAFNSTGSLIKQNSKGELDLQGQPPGLYTIVVKNKQGIVPKRVILIES